MKTKKIKDNITSSEFKHLITYLKADDSVRTNRKNRLLKIFSLLYSTGIRINEIQQINENHINELNENQKTIIVSHKQKTEKMIYSSKKNLKLIISYWNKNKGHTITSERNNKLHPVAMIQDVNSYLKKVFPNKRITSHSFRQTLITELATKGINTKIIQSLIGHKNINTTYRYIKVSENDILNSLEVVR